jgi:hypothetical protein
MKTKCSRAALVLTMIGLGGCSGSDESQVSELPVAKSLAAASINPTATPGSAAAITSSTTAGLNGATIDTANEVERFRNPFAPPKGPPPPPIVKEPDPEPESVATEEPTPEVRQPGMPPKLRLLGFMNVGEPKALISLNDELETLAIGDTLEDMKVIKIESPELTMLFDEREIKVSLFDQAWRHAGGRNPAGNNSRGQTRPRSTRSPRDTHTSASGGATANDPTREPSGQPPVSTATGSTPGALIGTPPPRLPGLTSEASSSAGTGDGDLPDFPGLDVDFGRRLGAGELPAVPGGP